jgi:hypothetical protein
MRALVERAARHGVPEVQFKAVQSGMPGFRLDELPAGELRAHASAAVDAALDLGVRATFNDRAFTDGLDAARVARAGAARPRANPHPFPSRPVFGPAGARADAAADREDEEEVGALLERVADAHRVSAHQRCFKPFSYTYVNYRAEMGTCNHMMYPDMLVMGDLARQPLGEIWNGPGYRDFRRQLLEAAPRDPRCQWCFRYRLDD